nr:MAG TPA: hypothetical protein [Caudoviricetes sp.]
MRTRRTVQLCSLGAKFQRERQVKFRFLFIFVFCFFGLSDGDIVCDEKSFLLG